MSALELFTINTEFISQTINFQLIKYKQVKQRERLWSYDKNIISLVKNLLYMTQYIFYENLISITI